MIRNDNYVMIHGWMINELKLKGYELITYAIIYGFSQDGETKYTGSLNYISDFLGVTKPTTIKCLKSLVDKNYILKERNIVNNVMFNTYKINLLVVKNLNLGSKKILPTVVKNLNLGSKKILPNNNINNTNIYINNNNNSQLEIALSNFEEMRRKIKKPLTDNAKELLLKKLDKIAKTEEEKIEILNQSILNCWQGVFPLKEDNKEAKSSFNITKFDVRG